MFACLFDFTSAIGLGQYSHYLHTINTEINRYILYRLLTVSSQPYSASPFIMQATDFNNDGKTHFLKEL